MCKHQFCKLYVHHKYVRSGPSGFLGVFTAHSTLSMDTCARIPKIIVLSYHFFAICKLQRRALLCHRYLSERPFTSFLQDNVFGSTVCRSLWVAATRSECSYCSLSTSLSYSHSLAVGISRYRCSSSTQSPNKHCIVGRLLGSDNRARADCFLDSKTLEYSSSASILSEWRNLNG